MENQEQNSKPEEERKTNGIPTELITEPQQKLSFDKLLSHLLHTEAKDVTLKWVFDHVRNYIICGVVLWGGIGAFSLPKPSYIDLVTQSIGGVVLIVSSLLLFALNLFHGVVGVSKIRNLGTIGKYTYLISCLLVLFAAQILYRAAKSS